MDGGAEMITLDALARELGCTLGDLDDLGAQSFGAAPIRPETIVDESAADNLRAAWLDAHGGIDA